MQEEPPTFSLYFLTSSKLVGSLLEKRRFDLFIQVAQTAEKLNFHSILIPEHYMLPKNSMIYDTWSSIATLTAYTQKIRLGSCVTPLPFVNPALMAKKVASIDQISNGRVILGVGCGWNEEEFNALGIPFDPFQTRIQKMIEAIEIIQKLWKEEDVTYSGKYYHVKHAVNLPKPFQKPHPPIWFGGKSPPILKAVAKYGDGWIPSGYYTPPSEYNRKCELLKKLVHKANRNIDKITHAITLQSIIGTNQEVKQQIRKLLNDGSHISIQNKDQFVMGTPQRCVQRIHDYMNAGAKHFAIGILSPKKIAESLQLYADEVIPNI